MSISHIWKSVPQKSLEWFQKRHTMITASDVASILEVHPFVSAYELLQKKIQPFRSSYTKTKATEWGEKYEPYALEEYKKLPIIQGNKKVHTIGLVTHPTYTWLGASPDGLVQSMDNKNAYWLLEIKCPYKRNFENKGTKLPIYIWIQVQIQMEVCNLSFCHIYQCRYNEDNLCASKLSTIERDTNWFNTIAFPRIKKFYELVQKGKEYSNLQNPYPNPVEWVSLHSFYGYLLEDPLLDWLDYYKNTDSIQKCIERNPPMYNKKNNQKTNITFSLIQKLQDFSEKNNFTYTYISSLDNKNYESLSIYQYNKTKEAIEQKYDIIIRPVLLDYTKKSYGIADCIIHNKVLKEFCKEYNIIIQDLDTISSVDGYVVCCTTLKNTYPYNSKLSKWDKILHKIYSKYATITGSICSKETNILLLGNTSGIICKKTFTDTIHKGIEWVHTIRNEGTEWLSCIDKTTVPTNKKMMPNMCNKYDNVWRNVKKELAERWGEITLLWYCGIQQRRKAHSKNIFSWKSDIPISTFIQSMYTSSEQLYSKRKNIMSSMIQLHRTNHKIYHSVDFGELSEPYIDTDKALEVFIDFEVLPSGIFVEKQKETIYLIGMYWKNPETQEFVKNSFIAENISLYSEKKMIQEWWKNVKSIRRKYKKEKVILYHWSKAEERFLDKAFSRHSLHYMKDSFSSGKYELRDLMEMYVEGEVVIRNVWSYSVKDIAKGLHKNGFIPEVWDDTKKGGDMVQNGEGSVFAATTCYRESNTTGCPIHDVPRFQYLQEYNLMDCKVLYYLLLFLRMYIYTKDPRQLRRNHRKHKITLEDRNPKKRKS